MQRQYIELKIVYMDYIIRTSTIKMISRGCTERFHSHKFNALWSSHSKVAT